MRTRLFILLLLLFSGIASAQQVIKLLSNPDAGNGIQNIFYYRNSIFTRYTNGSLKGQLSKYNGETHVLIPNPQFAIACQKLNKKR